MKENAFNIITCTKCGSNDTFGEAPTYEGVATYCNKCKSTFTHSKPDFVKCNNCGHGVYLKDKEEAICIRCGATANRHNRNIEQPDINATKKNTEQSILKNAEIKPPIKNKINRVSILTGLALILLVAVLINGFKSCDNTTHSSSTTNPYYQQEKQDDIPDNTQAYTISKNFVDDYVTDVSYGFIEEPIVIHTDNAYTVTSHFSVDHIKYSYECTMAFLGGRWSEKRNWKLLFFYIEGKEFYYDEDYKKYIKR